jgi:hypothetical protein
MTRSELAKDDPPAPWKSGQPARQPIIRPESKPFYCNPERTALFKSTASFLSLSSVLYPDVGRGAHDRNRTGDLVLTKDVLYRLSYVSA